MKSSSLPPRVTHESKKSRGGVIREELDQSGVVPRRLACDVLNEVIKQKMPIHEALLSVLPKDILPKDEQQIVAIVSATFRRYQTLYQCVEQHLPKGMPKNERLKAILLTGAAQILFLHKPPHAVVDSAVRIAKSHSKTVHAAGLVNAVLRKVSLSSELSNLDPMIDVPAWLRERWVVQYGLEQAQKIAVAHRIPANVDITLKGLSGSEYAKEWLAKLEGILLPTGSIRLVHRRSISELPGYREGAWWVQDVSSTLPVKMLTPQKGEKIIDLCAAPGGKTAQLAVLGAHVTAVDRSEERLKRLRQNMNRLQLDVTVLTKDALELPDKEYDAVLLDAPCSATGTIRRHPEAAWIKSNETIKSLIPLQEALLNKAARLVKPGGCLVYCTCSLEFEEGENQIKHFLERYKNFERDSQSVKNLGMPELENKDGDMRALPFYLPSSIPDDETHYGMDGFFASCLRRKVDM